MNKKAEVIFIRRSAIHQLGIGLIVLATFVSLVGIGVLINSDALQWVGAFLALVAVFMRAAKANKSMTIAEARQYLDELEKSNA